MTLKQIILIAIILFGSFIFFNIIFHELTHVALNDFRIDGVCILNCSKMKIDGLMGNGYTPVGVYLSNPINPFAENENIAFIIGAILGTISCILITSKAINIIME